MLCSYRPLSTCRRDQYTAKSRYWRWQQVPNSDHRFVLCCRAGQTAAGQELKPQEAMDMLSTCDGRLQALMAEANLLGETASSQMQTSAEDLELRQAFASILIESGEAFEFVVHQKQYCQLYRLQDSSSTGPCKTPARCL